MFEEQKRKQHILENAKKYINCISSEPMDDNGLKEVVSESSYKALDEKIAITEVREKIGHKLKFGGVSAKGNKPGEMFVWFWRVDRKEKHFLFPDTTDCDRGWRPSRETREELVREEKDKPAVVLTVTTSHSML
jgi:hypothetical protein